MKPLDLTKRMVVGFTGTRAGMTNEQIRIVGSLLDSYKPEEAHHGDCIGADAQFHVLALERGIRIIIHPASGVGVQRAYCTGAYFVHDPKPPLERNKDIVDACDSMIATPKEHMEIIRSGTWAAVRYTVKQGKSVYIVRPDGTLERL